MIRNITKNSTNIPGRELGFFKSTKLKVIAKLDNYDICNILS